MHIKELTNNQFEEFTLMFPEYSIYQTQEYAFVMNTQNFDSMFIGLTDTDDNIIAASLLLIEKRLGFKYAYAPHGFLLDYKDDYLLNVFTEELKSFLGKQEIIGVKLNPKIKRDIYSPKNKLSEHNDYFERIFSNFKKLGYYHFGFNQYFEALKPRFEAVIDLNNPYYILFKNIKKSFRTKIRSAEHSGIKIYKGDINDLNLLYEHTQNSYPRDLNYFKTVYEFYDKKHMIDFYYAKLDTEKYLQIIQNDYSKCDAELSFINNEIIENASRRNSKLISQKMALDKKFSKIKEDMLAATKMLKENPGGIVMASLLLIKYRDEVTVLIDGYNVKYKRFNAKHLLIWKLIEKYSKIGYEKLSLGGISDYRAQNNKYHNLNEFKFSFGAESYEYIGDLELITNDKLYFLYRNITPIKRILKK